MLDLMETTHQIVFYKDNIIRVSKPKIDGECCGKIQLINTRLELIDEIDCFEPYPTVKINKDSVIVVYSIFRSEEYGFKGAFDYYEDKFQMLGTCKLSYQFKYVFSTIFGFDACVDSIQRNGQIVTFYRYSHVIAKISIQELFYENNYFYVFRNQDSVREKLNFKPINNGVYLSFFKQLDVLAIPNF